MQVIPVIDLLDGFVVHAQQGKRAEYAPIQSSLTNSATPEAIIAALLALYPFTTLYIADLNSIQAKAVHAPHYSLIAKLQKIFPKVSFWVDAGVQAVDSLQQWQDLGIKPVIGTENCADYETFIRLTQAQNKSGILSLDHLDERFMGHVRILEQTTHWPETVIAMTLAKVGANTGPDFAKLAEIRAKTNNKLIAAGGVRHLADLQALQNQQIQGALVATALHQGRLTTKEIDSLQP